MGKQELNNLIKCTLKKGLHIFVTATNANITRHRRQGGFVEIYGNAQYFTVTGDVYADLERIAERPAELQRLHDQYLLSEPPKTVTHKTVSRRSVRRSPYNAAWRGTRYSVPAGERRASAW